jgi:hypothetical protein
MKKEEERLIHKNRNCQNCQKKNTVLINGVKYASTAVVWPRGTTRTIGIKEEDIDIWEKPICYIFF